WPQRPASRAIPICLSCWWNRPNFARFRRRRNPTFRYDAERAGNERHRPRAAMGARYLCVAADRSDRRDGAWLDARVSAAPGESAVHLVLADRCLASKPAAVGTRVVRAGLPRARAGVLECAPAA